MLIISAARCRSEGSSLGLVARHTHVFQELGITRGQYTGLLPLLVRHGVAELFLMPEQDAAAAAEGKEQGARGSGSGVVLGPAADGGWAEVGLACLTHLLVTFFSHCR